ncbi:MAG TPA: MarR family transcriptional regulator [Pseudonocardiaceae bacterium]|nr:MarR family transcriptional regulator [Pseudonocardiaceae bacterium]
MTERNGMTMSDNSSRRPTRAPQKNSCLARVRICEGDTGRELVPGETGVAQRERDTGCQLEGTHHMLDLEGGPGMVVGGTVAGAIVVAAHQLQLRVDDELREFGLSARRFVALCAIRDNPGLSRAALGRVMGIAPQAVGSMAARLMAAGLVDSSPRDPGNPTYYRLTPRGLDRLQHACKRVARLEQHVTALLHDTTLERIVGDMVALRDILAGVPEEQLLT